MGLEHWLCLFQLSARKSGVRVKIEDILEVAQSGYDSLSLVLLEVSMEERGESETR